MTDNKSLEEEFTGEMGRIIAERYLHTLQRVHIGNEMNESLRDVQKRLDKTEITWELCLDLMTSLIVRRYDYILKDAAEAQRTKDLKKLSFHFGIPVEDLQKALAAKDEPLANKENK